MLCSTVGMATDQLGSRRAKRITVSVARNEIMDQSSLIARYQQEIQLLKRQLDMVMRERERQRSPAACGGGLQAPPQLLHV